jgi:hypothetical protein
MSIYVDLKFHIMKTSKQILIALLLSACWLPARAQYYIGETWNVGGTVSYYTSLAIVPSNAVPGYHANSGALTIHGGTTLQVDEHYGASGNSVDSFTGDGSAVWPPVPATKTISGTDQPFFAIAKFMNGAGQVMDITNEQGILINGRLDFANGITNTVRSNHSIGSIEFGTTATYTNTALGDAQHVNGYVTKRTDGPFTFPVGSGTDLRTLSMSATDVGTNSAYSVAWIPGDPGTTGDPSNGNALHSRSSVTAPIMSVSAAGQWDWETTALTLVTITVTVSIPDLSGTGVLPADLRLVGWNGTSWIDLSGAPNATGNTEGSTLSGTMTGNMVASIKAIGIGSTSVALPVTFSSFTAQKENCNAVLNWTTAMEHNNQYFAVERSGNGRLFEAIGQVASTGNSTSTQHYSYIDSKPLNGPNHYRIAQVDVDGKHTTTGVQALHFDCNTTAVQVYPSPTTGTLNINLPAGYDHAEIKVYDALGREVSLPVTSKTGAGLHILQFSGLAQGQYLVRVANGSNTQIFKVVYQP